MNHLFKNDYGDHESSLPDRMMLLFFSRFPVFLDI